MLVWSRAMKGNNTLPSLWDGLSLPKLMSGAVRVK